MACLVTARYACIVTATPFFNDMGIGVRACTVWHASLSSHGTVGLYSNGDLCLYSSGDLSLYSSGDLSLYSSGVFGGMARGLF